MPERGGEGSGSEDARLRVLHGGRHSLSPELVAFNQRERLLASLAEAVAADGYNGATIAQITDGAQVSRRTFYEHFSGKEECFLAAYDAVDSYVGSLLADALAADSPWAERVAETITILLAFLASRPALARLYLVESAVVGEATAERRARSAEVLVTLLAAGREEPEAAGREPAEGIEEAVVGGMMTLLVRRINAGEAAGLESFGPGLIEFALSPYLGSDAARRLATRRP